MIVILIGNKKWEMLHLFFFEIVRILRIGEFGDFLKRENKTRQVLTSKQYSNF